MTPGRPKILIFGARGRLGAALARTYADHFDLRALGRAEGDLSAPAACADFIRAEKPTIVINSAAMTNVDLCETKRSLARTINAEVEWRVREGWLEFVGHRSLLDTNRGARRGSTAGWCYSSGAEKVV